MGAVKQWMLEQHERELEWTGGHDWRLLEEGVHRGRLRMECVASHSLATIPLRAMDARQRGMALPGGVRLLDLYYREGLPTLPYRLAGPAVRWEECPGHDPFDSDE
jgi:hypothetical protein